MKRNLYKNLLLCIGVIFLIVACSLQTSLVNDTYQQDASFIMKSDTISLSCSLIEVKRDEFGKIYFPTDGISPSLTIKYNGSFSGYAGCNSFFGNYTKQGDSIAFGNMMGTLKNCANISVEGKVKETLRRINNFSIEENNLLLKNDAEILMVYRINQY